MRPRPKLERLHAECSRHGRVRVVCPKCAGKKGGRGRKGFRKNFAELKRALRLLTADPNALLDSTEQLGDGHSETTRDDL